MNSANDPHAEYDTLLRAVRREDGDVRFCVRCGSHVYGTAGPDSDWDYLLVFRDVAARQDLVRRTKLNIVIHGAGTYSKALEEQSVFALEALFAPTEHRLKEPLPPFSYRRNMARLFDSAKARSDSDWNKARKKFDEEPEPSKKRVWHALRVLAFANQIAERGAIVDFRAPASWWGRLRGVSHETWDALAEEFAPIRDGLLADLRRRPAR